MENISSGFFSSNSFRAFHQISDLFNAKGLDTQSMKYRVSLYGKETELFPFQMDNKYLLKSLYTKNRAILVANIAVSSPQEETITIRMGKNELVKGMFIDRDNTFELDELGWELLATKDPEKRYFINTVNGANGFVIATLASVDKEDYFGIDMAVEKDKTVFSINKIK